MCLTPEQKQHATVCLCNIKSIDVSMEFVPLIKNFGSLQLLDVRADCAGRAIRRIDLRTGAVSIIQLLKAIRAALTPQTFHRKP